MSRSKVIAVSIVVVAVFGIAMIDGAVANDKIKWHGTGITVKWEQIEVGDDEGHVIAITQSKQIYINETTGEKSTSVSMGLMDINPKMGQASGHGYGVNFEKDGSKIIRSWEGKAVGEDHWQGVWKVIKGTGKYKGATGEGTWDSYSLAPQYEYLETEGEFKVPEQ